MTMDQILENPSTLTLDTLELRVKQCARCPLSETRTNIVFGEGDTHARVVLVGEGPGEVEDQTGKPFVGRSLTATSHCKDATYAVCL